MSLPRGFPRPRRSLGAWSGPDRTPGTACSCGGMLAAGRLDCSVIAGPLWPGSGCRGYAGARRHGLSAKGGGWEKPQPGAPRRPQPESCPPAPCPCSEEERRERLTTNDALSYLREVKTRFANNRKVYDRCADDAGGARGGGALPPPLKDNRACCWPSRPLPGTSSRISPWQGPCRCCQPAGHPRTSLAQLSLPPTPLHLPPPLPAASWRS